MTNCRELASPHQELSLLGQCPSCQRSVLFQWKIYKINATGHRELIPNAETLTKGAGQQRGGEESPGCGMDLLGFPLC